jgi:hypothetical protein
MFGGCTAFDDPHIPWLALVSSCCSDTRNASLCPLPIDTSVYFCFSPRPAPTPRVLQSAYRDTQTLVKHSLGLYDLKTFADTKASLQIHLDMFT